MAALVASAATAVEKGLSPVRKKTKEEDIKPCPSKACPSKACPSCNDEEGYDGKAICRFCKEDAGPAILTLEHFVKNVENFAVMSAQMMAESTTE